MVLLVVGAGPDTGRAGSGPHRQRDRPSVQWSAASRRSSKAPHLKAAQVPVIPMGGSGRHMSFARSLARTAETFKRRGRLTGSARVGRSCRASPLRDLRASPSPPRTSRMCTRTGRTRSGPTRQPGSCGRAGHGHIRTAHRSWALYFMAARRTRDNGNGNGTTSGTGTENLRFPPLSPSARCSDRGGVITQHPTS